MCPRSRAPTILPCRWRAGVQLARDFLRLEPPLYDSVTEFESPSGPIVRLRGFGTWCILSGTSMILVLQPGPFRVGRLNIEKRRWPER